MKNKKVLNLIYTSNKYMHKKKHKKAFSEDESTYM